MAVSLKTFLEAVIAAPRYFMSSDIGAGEVWRNVIAGQLGQTNIGIAVLTIENIKSHWIHWEAGAISKSTQSSLVIPYLVRLTDTELLQPLADLQWKQANMEDTRDLVEQLNIRQPESVRTQPNAVQSVFDTQWPALEESIMASGEAEEPSESRVRPESDVQAEMLRRLRQIEAVLSSQRADAGIGTAEVHRADAERRIKSYVRLIDEAIEFKWDSEQGRFDLLLDNSSDYPPTNRVDRDIVKALALPWDVNIWGAS